MSKLWHAHVHAKGCLEYILDYHHTARADPIPSPQSSPPLSRPVTIHPLPSNNLQQTMNYRPQVMLPCLFPEKLWKDHPGGLPGPVRDLKDIKPLLRHCSGPWTWEVDCHAKCRQQRRKWSEWSFRRPSTRARSTQGSSSGVTED